MDDCSSETNLNESLEESNSFLDVELETLQSIYINEIEVKTDGTETSVSIDLHPSTADNLEEQYVRMTLQFTLAEEYPDLIPLIKIRNPRGLSDEKLNCITKELESIAENKRGSSMLFEMIEAAKDHLTTGNRPSGECAICLYGFSENDVFTKTECYHYFHSHCLARYYKNFRNHSEDSETDSRSKAVSNELLCPMCRIPIQFNGCEEDFPLPEESDDTAFIPNAELLELQEKMSELYQKQIEKGGIIDVEAEKNKYLLEISNVPTRVNVEEKTDQKAVIEKDGEVVAEYEVADIPEFVSSPSKERKMQNRDQTRRFDYKDKNRNYNRQDDNRKRYRYNQGYNKQNSNNYGNYNKNNYRKQYGDKFEKRNQTSSLRNERISWDACVSASDLEHNTTKDNLNTDCMVDDKTEVSEQQSFEGRKYNYQNKYSDTRPKCIRGHYQGYHYGNNSSRNDEASNVPLSNWEADSSDLENAEKKDIDCLGDDKSETSEQQSSEGRRFNYQNKYSDFRPGDDKSETSEQQSSEGRKYNYQNKYSDSRPKCIRGHYRGYHYRNNSSRNHEASNVPLSNWEAGSSDLENAEKKDIDCMGDDKSQTSEQQSSEGRRFNYQNKYSDSRPGDDKSETSEQQSFEGRRFNHQNKYSDSRPRYSRGYHRGNYYGNGSNHNGSQRPDRSNYRDSNNAQSYRNYDYKTNESGDYDSRKTDNRSVNYKRDDYGSRDKYSERNSHRGYRGGYGRRENYFHDDNDSRRNRYSDREQYHSEKDRSFKDKRTTREGRYEESGNNYGYKRSSRNYSENKLEKSTNESPNKLPEQFESVSLSQTSESNIHPPESETTDPNSGTYKDLSQIKECSPKADASQFVEQCSSSLTDKSSLIESGLSSLKLNVNLQGSTRTALNPPPGFANPLKKVIYGLQGANPPPGFQRS